MHKIVQLEIIWHRNVSKEFYHIKFMLTCSLFMFRGYTVAKYLNV